DVPGAVVPFVSLAREVARMDTPPGRPEHLFRHLLRGHADKAMSHISPERKSVGPTSMTDEVITDAAVDRSHQVPSPFAVPAEVLLLVLYPVGHVPTPDLTDLGGDFVADEGRLGGRASPPALEVEMRVEPAVTDGGEAEHADEGDVALARVLLEGDCLP